MKKALSDIPQKRTAEENEYKAQEKQETFQGNQNIWKKSMKYKSNG